MSEFLRVFPLRRIAVIGLGCMGKPMAARLMGAGFEASLLGGVEFARNGSFEVMGGGDRCSARRNHR